MIALASSISLPASVDGLAASRRFMPLARVPFVEFQRFIDHSALHFATLQPAENVL